MRISKGNFNQLIKPGNILTIVTFVFVVIFVIYFIDQQSDNNEQRYYRTGELAKNYLQGNKYSKVIIEIDSVEGYKPNDQSIDLLKSRIEQYCNKNSVVVDKASFNTIPKTKSKYYIEDILKLENEYRNQYMEGDSIGLYYIFLNGEYETGNVLGVAYSGSSIGIFKETIQNAANDSILITEEDIERSVVVHEFGHLLSLVNIGYVSERDHHDESHPRHCNHEEYEGTQIYDCVMYYAVETTSVSINSFYNILRGLPDDFCEDCKYDIEQLKNNQEKKNSINEYHHKYYSEIAVDNSIFSINFIIKH